MCLIIHIAEVLLTMYLVVLNLHILICWEHFEQKQQLSVYVFLCIFVVVDAHLKDKGKDQDL